MILKTKISGKSENNNNTIKLPPLASAIPSTFKIHNQQINDKYSWLRDPNWPEVQDKRILNYLEEENNYFEQFFSPLEEERKKILQELKSMIALDDQSLFVRRDNYYYYSKFKGYEEYPIYCRRRVSSRAQEEILLDVNYLAKYQKLAKFGTFSISSNHKYAAYSIDFVGDERYTIKILNLETKEYLNDEIKSTIGNIVWHKELEGFFYTPTNKNWRNDKVMFHLLGTNSTNDILVFHELDQHYLVTIKESGSHEYLYINVSGYDSNVNYIIPMQDHEFTALLVRPREHKVFYDVEHSGDYFYIKINYKAKNFRMVRLGIDKLQDSTWEESYIKEEDNNYLSSFDITQNYLLLNYFVEGLPLIKVKNLANGEEKIINFPEQVFTAHALSTNFEENDIKIDYSSLITPNTTFSYNFKTEKIEILKKQEIPCGYNRNEYEIKRIFADNDGVKIPITLFYKKSLFKKDGSNPLYLYGYGSYGSGMTLHFQNYAIPLVNKGFIYAISHVRGGDELGQEWYESGKLLNKKNTFADFILSSEELIKQKYTSKGNIAICGRSAGGMLIGNVINERPELFKLAIAQVPFVDVLNTMLDDTLPLTPGEFNEWGNPKNDQEYFYYIKSYSPYDNIKSQNYPSLLFTAGLSDPRVGYWEAAKMVAKLRATKTDNNVLLLKTNMDTGHFGTAGRFDNLERYVEELLFIFTIFEAS